MSKKPENPIPKCIRRKQCLQEIQDIIEKIGPWNVNKLTLSKKYDFDWETVDRWYKKLLRGITPEVVSNLQVMIENSLSRNVQACERIIIDPNTSKRDRISAVKASNDTLSKLTEFLQDWGRKQKVADKVEVSGEGDILGGLMQKYADRDKS